VKEFNKLIEIKQWDGAGNLKFNLDLKENSEKVSYATLNLEVKNFVLSRNSKRILPKQDILAEITTVLEIGQSLADSKLNRPQAKIKSSLGTGNINATSVTWNALSALPDASDIK
jgi:hypothetical protein